MSNMAEISEHDKKMGYITSILSIVIAMVGMFAPMPFAAGVVLVIIGFACALYAIIKGDTGGKILGALGPRINLGLIFLVLTALSL